MVAEVIGRVDRLCPLDVRENLLASFREPQHLKLPAVWNRFCGVGIGMSSRTENLHTCFFRRSCGDLVWTNGQKGRQGQSGSNYSALRAVAIWTLLLFSFLNIETQCKRSSSSVKRRMSYHVQDAGRRLHVDNGGGAYAMNGHDTVALMEGANADTIVQTFIRTCKTPHLSARLCAEQRACCFQCCSVKFQCMDILAWRKIG